MCCHMFLCPSPSAEPMPFSEPVSELVSELEAVRAPLAAATPAKPRTATTPTIATIIVAFIFVHLSFSALRAGGRPLPPFAPLESTFGERVFGAMLKSASDVLTFLKSDPSRPRYSGLELDPDLVRGPVPLLRDDTLLLELLEHPGDLRVGHLCTLDEVLLQGLTPGIHDRLEHGPL